MNSTFLQDLEEFVNDSGDDGFVVFTLGSMVANMPEERAKLFFDAFRQIPQRVDELQTCTFKCSLEERGAAQLSKRRPVEM